MAKTILLADDSVTIQKVVELTFMDEDYLIVATSDGRTALDRLPDVAPVLVIADIHMPGADGYEVCRQVKESYPGIPVLLLVGTFEQFDEQKAVAVGADGHLKKPFDSQDLLSKVKALVADSAASSSTEGLPTSEVRLTDFPDLSAPAPDVGFAAEESEAIGDLEPPPLLDDFGSPFADLRSDDTRPTEARSALPERDATFEMAEPAEAEAAVTDFDAPTFDAPTFDALKTTSTQLQGAAEEPVSPAAASEAVAVPAVAAASVNGSSQLSDEDVDRIARRVAELMGAKTLREVAWEVIPDLAEVIIKERIRELESQVE